MSIWDLGGYSGGFGDICGDLGELSSKIGQLMPGDWGHDLVVVPIVCVPVLQHLSPSLLQ